MTIDEPGKCLSYHKLQTRSVGYGFRLTDDIVSRVGPIDANRELWLDMEDDESLKFKLILYYCSLHL